MKALSDMRYLTFEVNPNCDMEEVHPKCPVGDPERYKFGQQAHKVPDDIIVDFYDWCVRSHGFRGIILWHLYNEPSLATRRINRLTTEMKLHHPDQRFHLWTNSPLAAAVPMKFGGLNHVQLTDYSIVRPDDLDNRRASTRGEGKPYAQMPPVGHCTRGFGWELIIDYYGNWLLCCNDWRCEESVGNVLVDHWDTMLDKFREKAIIEWSNQTEYNALPRMCRSCMTVNPGLHRSANMPPGVEW